MALRWLLDMVNRLIFGQPPGRSTRHPPEGKVGDGTDSGCINHGRVEFTKSVGCQNEVNSSKGIVLVKSHVNYPTGFQMPLHYPRYKKEDYERMEEWKVDMILREYGLTFHASLEEKRAYAIGTFLWPDQL